MNTLLYTMFQPRQQGLHEKLSCREPMGASAKNTRMLTIELMRLFVYITQGCIVGDFCLFCQTRNYPIGCWWFSELVEHIWFLWKVPVILVCTVNVMGLVILGLWCSDVRMFGCFAWLQMTKCKVKNNEVVKEVTSCMFAESMLIPIVSQFD